MIEISTQGFDLGREIDSQRVRSVDTDSPPLWKLSISTFEPVDNSDPLNPTEFFSYEALKSRLQVNRFESHELRDFSQPVIRLLPLNHNEIFVLLKNLKLIYDFYLGHSIAIEDEEVHRFMEVMYNKPGAAEFLTPREVIRDFLNALAVIEADPTVDKQQLFNSIFIRDERPDQQAVFNEIEEY